MIRIEFLIEEGIVHVKRDGEVTASDIVDYIIELDEECSHLESLLVLDTIGGSKSILTNIDQFKVFEKEIANRISKYKLVKHTMLVEEPLETALVYMFQEIANTIDGYRAEVFSTENAARNWLEKECIIF